MPVARCVLPLIFVRCSPSSTFPKSVVNVTSTSGPFPPMLISPTEDSGFDCVLAENMRLTASACASHLEGLIVEEASQRTANTHNDVSRTHSLHFYYFHCCRPCTQTLSARTILMESSLLTQSWSPREPSCLLGEFKWEQLCL